MKMKISILPLAILFLTIVANAQNEPSKTILIDKFHTLSANDNLNVELIRSTHNSIDFLETGINKTSVSYSLKNGILHLSSSNPSESSNVLIYASNLKKITASDLVRIEIQGLFAGDELSAILNDISKFKGSLELNSLIVEANDASVFETSGSTNSFRVTAN
ncbi:MAG: DUF2807 domain-containing protein, partial [Bacteroidales bacterium]|nr:DUF2807 domain-containing protein [Bacteroidales bacterium]